MEFEFDVLAFASKRKKYDESEAKNQQLKMEVEIAGQIYHAIQRENNVGDQTQVVLKGNDVSEVVKETVSEVKDIVRKRVRFDKKVKVSLYNIILLLILIIL